MRRAALILLTVLIFSESINEALARGPEDYNPSKKQTILSWVATKYHKKKRLLERIQRCIYRSLPQNMNDSRNSKIFIIPVNLINDKDAKQYFGETWYLIADFDVPFFQAVNKESQRGSVVVVEFGGGRGFISSMTVFALENTTDKIYYNDINTTMMNESYDGVMRKVFLGAVDNPVDNRKKFISYIKKFPGSCLDALDLNNYEKPDLTNQVNFVFAKNLQRFFNPIQDQKFLDVIMQLLKENGEAYLLTETFPFKVSDSGKLSGNFAKYYWRKLRGMPKDEKNQVLQNDLLKYWESLGTSSNGFGVQDDFRGENLFKNYVENYNEVKKEGGYVDDLPYMGFVEYDLDFSLTELQKAKDDLVYNVNRPEIDTATSLKGNVENEEYFKKSHAVNNFHTTGSYRAAVALYNSLHQDNPFYFKITDVYYVDSNGSREKTYGKNTLFVAAIIKKVKKNKKNVVVTVKVPILDTNKLTIGTEDTVVEGTRIFAETQGGSFDIK